MSTSKAIIWFRPESECPHELVHPAESSPEEPTLIERIKAIEMKLDQVIEFQRGKPELRIAPGGVNYARVNGVPFGESELSMEGQS